MTEQIILSLLLIGMMALFIMGRWRHDVVALSTLLLAVILGLVPTAKAFSGFGHPAVITVAAVLVISRALQLSGVFSLSTKQVARIHQTPLLMLFILIASGAFLSAFMNNVGALALLMPLALRISPNPSLTLMPLSFGTILGGMLTEIGTPPNIIIATFREEYTQTQFHLFDFTPVGLAVALAGIVFMTLFGSRFLPKKRPSRKTVNDVLEGASYMTEIIIPEGSPVIGKTTRQMERMVDFEAIAVGIIRGDRHLLGRLRNALLQVGDIIILRADASQLSTIIEKTGTELVASQNISPKDLGSDLITLTEAVVKPGAQIENRTAGDMHLRSRFETNLLAIAREGERFQERLSQVVIKAGDVLLLQGDRTALPETINAIGCMPLADRDLQQPVYDSPKFLTPMIFLMAIVTTALDILSVEISFSVAVALIMLLRIMSPREAYETVDWSVIVLLGALIPVGHALETTGATKTIAEFILTLADQLPAWGILAVVMIVTMALTNVMNNAAAAVVMAPIAVGIAQNLNVSIDTFLMAIAISASAAFLTPIGHQNNVLVMGPGGYKFNDFWKLGLPLQIIVLIVALPMLLMVWPL